MPISAYTAYGQDANDVSGGLINLHGHVPFNLKGEALVLIMQFTGGSPCGRVAVKIVAWTYDLHLTSTLFPLSICATAKGEGLENVRVNGASYFSFGGHPRDII